MEGIEVSLRATKLSPYYPLLYKEAVIATRTLFSHLVREDIYYELEFHLYQTVNAGRVWKMRGKLGPSRRIVERI